MFIILTDDISVTQETVPVNIYDSYLQHSMNWQKTHVYLENDYIQILQVNIRVFNCE